MSGVGAKSMNIGKLCSTIGPEVVPDGAEALAKIEYIALRNAIGYISESGSL